MFETPLGRRAGGWGVSDKREPVEILREKRPERRRLAVESFSACLTPLGLVATAACLEVRLLIDFSPRTLPFPIH